MVLVSGGILALLIRLLLVPNPGFEADVSFWKSWGLAVADLGIIKGLPLTNFNYPTPFGYALALMAKAYSVLGDPHVFNEYWLNTNIRFLFVSKLPAILADFGIAGIFLYIGKRAKSASWRIGFPVIHNSLFIILALVYLLNPISIIDGAWWGQIDSVGVFLLLMAVVMLLKRQPFWAGLVYMVAMMTKLQNMIYGPLFFLFAWQLTGPAGLARAAVGALTGFLGLNIEFILSHQMWRVVESITGNYDYFPWLSLNAFNPWWIYSGAAGMQGSDKVLVFGLVNAKTFGLYLFSGAYLFAILRLLASGMTVKDPDIIRSTANLSQKSFWNRLILHLKKDLDSKKVSGGTRNDRQDPNTKLLIKTFLESLIIVNASFFLFQTESHDRYAFPLIVFSLLWLPFYVSGQSNEVTKLRSSSRLKLFILFYGLFTLFYFYNLHTALVFNYPQNGIPFLNHLTQAPFTIGTAFVLTAGFIAFLLFLIRQSPWWTYLLPVSLIGVVLLAKNIPLVTKQPMYLTQIAPISAKQDYGQRQVNMPVGASEGFARWSSLSVQYAFYRHGIGTHANSSQLYDIGGHFKTFSFDYGIDTESGPKGSVTFEVWGDGKKLFGSGNVGRYDLPRHADVDVTGITLLELKVTDAKDGITDDHADWLNPLLWSK